MHGRRIQIKRHIYITHIVQHLREVVDLAHQGWGNGLGMKVKTLQALGAPNRTKLLVLLSQRGYRVPSMRAGSTGSAP